LANDRRAPERIRERHGTYEIRKLRADRRAPRSPAAGLPGPESAEALPVPANHSLGANEVERLSPPSPMVGEPRPEEAIAAPELRSLRSAAAQSKLLPERQVLEREVGAGSERRAQGAQQSEYEVHWPHGSHAPGPSSSLGREFWQTTGARRAHGDTRA
jgi:hypothetical protein